MFSPSGTIFTYLDKPLTKPLLILPITLYLELTILPITSKFTEILFLFRGHV